MRRLLVALLLSLPIAVAGLTTGAPARADDSRAESGVVTSFDPSFSYGDAVELEVWVLAEDVAPEGEVVLVVDGDEVSSFPLVVHAPGSTISTVPGAITLPLLEPGDHEVRVEFPGNDRLAPSSDTREVRVYPAQRPLSLTVSDDATWVGEEVAITAKVVPDPGALPGTAVPTGSISFESDGELLGVRALEPDGTATLTVDSLPEGSWYITATYSGDSRYDRGSAADSLYVSRVPTTTELTVSDPTPTYGDGLRLVARVRADIPDRGAPTGGVVEFVIDNTTIARVPVSPVEGPSDGVSSLAVLERSDIPAGAHWITARYLDSAGFERSDARGVDVRVARRATRTVASPVFLGVYPFVLPNAVLRATVTGSISGQPVAGVPVTFTAGKTALCTARTDAAGVATCDAAAQRLALTLNGGYVAAFPGDANNLASSARGNLIG